VDSLTNRKRLWNLPLPPGIGSIVCTLC